MAVAVPDPPTKRTTGSSGQYHVYPLATSDFRELPSVLQSALVKRGHHHNELACSPSAYEKWVQEAAESFEYLTRDGQHFVRINLQPQYVELSKSEDKAAIAHLSRMSEANKKKTRKVV
jgi:hypothetical protein